MADRIQMTLKKKQVTSNKGQSFEVPKNQEQYEAAFVIRPIGYLESVYREKFGTPR